MADHIHDPACECCGEKSGPMYLNARCHPGAGLQAALENGILTVSCHECEKLVAKFRIEGFAPVAQTVRARAL